MNPSELWLLKQTIKNGTYKFKVGDVVVVSHRNNKGYPKKLHDDVDYKIVAIEGESVSLVSDGLDKYNAIKVNRYYVMPKGIIRDIKLDLIFK
jgi:hypothetical protein